MFSLFADTFIKEEDAVNRNNINPMHTSGSGVHERKGIMTVYCALNLCHRRATAGVIVF